MFLSRQTNRNFPSSERQRLSSLRQSLGESVRSGDKLRIKYRINGALNVVEESPKSFAGELISLQSGESLTLNQIEEITHV